MKYVSIDASKMHHSRWVAKVCEVLIEFDDAGHAQREIGIGADGVLVEKYDKHGSFEFVNLDEVPKRGLPCRIIEQREFENKWTTGNHCSACGYSLTGNTSGTCPECGGASCR